MKLAFMHIPKTGGISVERAIAEAVPNNVRTCPAYYVPDYAQKSYADMPGYDIYQGHFDFDFIRTLPPEYKRTMVLRQPSDQVLSLCNHIASRPKHNLHAQAQGTSLADLLNANVSLHNAMAQYVLGATRYQEIVSGKEPTPHKIRQATTEILANLNQFDVIGVTARLKRFVRDVSRTLNVQIPAPLKENTNKYITYDVATLSDEDKEALRFASWLDRPAYRAIWRQHFAKNPNANSQAAGV